jgi:Skp family chaperone for outer membrane proteins
MSAEYRPQKTPGKTDRPLLPDFCVSNGRPQELPSMRMTHFALVVAIGGVGLIAASQLWAQRPVAPSSPRGGPVLVNMGAIMKHSARFNQSMERLKQEYEAKARELQKEGEQGNQITEEMRKMPANTPERKKLEEEIMQRRADYELHGKKVTEEIRDHEAKIVLGLLGDLKQELDRYGQASGTPLILRYDPAPEELTDPRMILQEIHKPIVYQSGLDATGSILEGLNRGAPPGAAPATGRAPAPARGVQR